MLTCFSFNVGVSWSGCKLYVLMCFSFDVGVS